MGGTENVRASLVDLGMDRISGCQLVRSLL